MFRYFFILLLTPSHVQAENISISGEVTGKRSCVEDFCSPSQTAIGSDVVKLRNLTKETYLIFDLYIAALYIADGVNGPSEVVGDVPKKLVFRYLRDFSRDQLVENANKVLATNPNIDLRSLSARLDQINQGYAGGVKAGDVYELEYDPSKGSTLIRNGKEFCTVPGSDFAKAYFGIWLSQYPLSMELRDSLLKSQDS